MEAILEREAVPATWDAPTPMPAPTPVVPLAVSGFVVDKRALVATLRALLPGLRDIRTDADGEQFFLYVGAVDATEGDDDDPAAR